MVMLVARLARRRRLRMTVTKDDGGPRDFRGMWYYRACRAKLLPMSEYNRRFLNVSESLLFGICCINHICVYGIDY